ncbi:MAG: hypothetical protein RLY13_871 [Actinomycetota bacterium]|jgi:hypothetical protein
MRARSVVISGCKTMQPKSVYCSGIDVETSHAALANYCTGSTAKHTAGWQQPIEKFIKRRHTAKMSNP